MLRASGLVALLLIVGASRLEAQVSLGFETGASWVTYEGDAAASAFSIGPTLDASSRSFSTWANASLSRFDEGPAVGQATAVGAWYAPTVAGLSPELGTVLSGSRSDEISTGSAVARARVHRIGAASGFWLGVGGGRAWDDASGVGTIQGDFGAWARLGLATIVITLAPTNVDRARFFDGELSARLARGRWEATAFAGLRDQNAAVGPGRDEWVGASGAYWFTDQLAAVAGAGTYPADVAQNLPGGRYVTIAFRFATRRPARLERQDAIRRSPPVAAPVIRPAVPAFAIDRVLGDSLRIIVHAPAASSVELMGTLTDWQPVPLTPQANGTWEATFVAERGTHRINVRTDGGEWGVPPGLPAGSDEFAGSVGLLVVE